MKGIFEKKDGFSFSAQHIKGFRGFAPMFHSHAELLLVTKGEISMTVDAQSGVVRAGEISVAFPYVVHSYEDAPEAEVYIILFEPKAVGIFESELLSQKPEQPFLLNHSHLLPLFKKCSEYMEGDSLSQKIALSYISVIVGELISSIPLCQVEAVSENTIKQILFYCSEHYTDSDIGIKKISDALYISESYVSKVFSSKLNWGLREYINELRITKAKQLLAHSDMKIVDIMFECGFKNQSSFNRIFYEIAGVCPSSYRKRKADKFLKGMYKSPKMC